MRRRRWVAPALLLGVAATALVDALLGGHLVGGPVPTVATVVTAYLVGAWLPPVRAALASLGAVTMLTAANQLADDGQYTAANDFFFFAVLVGGLALAGALISARAAQARELRVLTQVRAQQRAREVEAARLEERTRLDAGVTRAMMQRLSGLVVQASGIRSRGTARDREAVARVERGGRETLDELREVLGSLHSPEGHDEETHPPPDRPQPALDWIDLLVGCSGIPVAVECVATASTRGPALANVTLGVALGIPLVWRRRRPLLASTAFLGLAVVMASILTPLSGTVTILLPMSVSAYALGAYTRGRGRLAGVGVLLAAGLLMSLTNSASTTTDGLLPTLVWLAIALGAGVVAGQHADRADRLTQLMERIEAARDDEVRLAVAEQRQAIAHDLHDTVAHAMTLVCLHAEAAQQQWSDDRAVEDSLGVIEDAAREAMARLRTGLGVLESETGTGGELADDLSAFAASLGVPLTISADVALSTEELPLVRRLVREALVNTARHAAGSTACVEIVRDGGQLTVGVSNTAADGPGYTDGARRGLAGMQEAFAAHGGTVEHGPSRDGGYAVTGRLPAEPAPPTPPVQPTRVSA